VAVTVAFVTATAVHVGHAWANFLRFTGRIRRQDAGDPMLSVDRDDSKSLSGEGEGE
jgi:hypothetical protein